MERLFFLLSGVYGFLAVALGAFGAHGIKAKLDALPDGALRMTWWQTGAQYHLVHALALAVAAHLAARTGGAAATVAGFCFAGGMLLFSGSLYVMTVTGVRALAIVTPLGGLLLLVGWGAVAAAALGLVRG